MEPLRLNIADVHEGEKPNQCSICEYSTSKESDLKRHIKSVHEGKPFQCSICSYSTSREQDLKRHQSVHGVKRPYKCNDCNADFRTNKGLTQHLKSYCHKGKNVIGSSHTNVVFVEETFQQKFDWPSTCLRFMM